MILGGITFILLVLIISGCKSTTGADDPGENPNDPPVEDTQPPSVSIVSPTEGEEINGEYIIKVNASDDNEVESVNLYIDGEELGALTSAPYEWNVASTELYNGSYSLYANARDEAGNETTSDTITFDVLNYLFVLHLKDSWLDYEGIIQANNLDGSLIAEQEFSHSETYYLYPPAKESVDNGSSQNFEEIDITIARTLVSENTSKSVSIQTYLNVEAWSEWTVGQDQFNSNLGYIQLDYADASSFADHEGYILSSDAGFSHSYTNQITENTEIWVWNQPGTHYLATDISNSPQYLKLDDLYDGDQVTVELANFQNMSSHSISLPSSPNPTQLDGDVYGRNTDYKPGYWLTYLNSWELPGNTAEIFYPADAFPEYESDIYSTYDSDNGIHHYYTHGIPDEVKKLAGGITLMNSSVDNLEFNTNSGDFDEFLIISYYSPDGEDSFYWSVYGPQDRETVTYPEVGTFFITTYPDFDRNSFDIWYIDLFKYPGLQNGYRESNQLIYENGGQTFNEAISEYIHYYEFIPSSGKNKLSVRREREKVENGKIPSRYHN